jgi:EmrB/QacA subfamily drug resistance transporter
MTDRVRLHDGNRRWWTLFAMCFALFMIMLDNTVVNVALPSIQRDLHTSLSGLEWTINAYTLAFGVLLVTGGRLGDIFGRRKMFLFGVVTFAASSAAIGLAPTDLWLVAGRAAQGVGAAFMMPATLSIITNAFPAEERGKAIGTWAGVSAIALAIGPLLGGFLVEHVSWRAIFYINIPVAALAVAVTLFAAHESRDETVSKSVDIPGILAITTGLGTLILALVEGNQWGWGSPEILALFATSLLGIVGFIAIELHSRAPMVDFQFFKSRTFVGASLVAFMISFAMLGVFFFVALYMQNILGYSPIEAGAMFLPTTVLIMILGPIAGRLTDRVGPRGLIVFGMTMLTISLFWQSFLKVGSGVWFLAPGFLLLGIGIAFTMSPMSTAAMNAVDRTKAGVASGVLSMSRMVGGSFGVAAMGALVIGVGKSKLSELLPNLPAGRRADLAESLGAGGASQGGQLGHAMNEAFVSAVSVGLRVSAAMAATGAVLAWFLIAKKVPAAVPAAEQAEAAAPLGVAPQAERVAA